MAVRVPPRRASGHGLSKSCWRAAGLAEQAERERGGGTERGREGGRKGGRKGKDATGEGKTEAGRQSGQTDVS